MSVDIKNKGSQMQKVRTVTSTLCSVHLRLSLGTLVFTGTQVLTVMVTNSISVSNWKAIRMDVH